jgi:type IV pilus assembly protein PilO
MAVTLEDIKRMPPLRKALLIGLVFILLGYFYYFYFLQDMIAKRGELAERLSSINQEIAEKQIFAKQIEKYKKEVDVLKKNLQIALAKLPERKEISGLLDSVSEAGRRVDLEFLLFEPMSEVSKEGLYAEIPVKVEAAGSYHNIAIFFEKVGKLPRIMNIANISIRTIEDTKEKSKNDYLICSCIVKTYMFLEEKEVNKSVATTGRK